MVSISYEILVLAMGPPDLLEVNMGDSDHNSNQIEDSLLEPEDAETQPEISESEDVEEKSIKQEPTPSTSSQGRLTINDSINRLMKLNLKKWQLII